MTPLEIKLTVLAALGWLGLLIAVIGLVAIAVTRKEAEH